MCIGKSKLKLWRVWLLALVTSCVVDEPSSDMSRYLNTTQNPAARYLLQAMDRQVGSGERFADVLQGGTPLFDYTEVALSERYGIYFFVPYEHDGVIAGGIVCPVDEALPLEERMVQGVLGTPVVVDAHELNEVIPITERCMYSAKFVRLRTAGYRVDDRLTAFCDLLAEKGRLDLGDAFMEELKPSPDSRADTERSYEIVIYYRYETSSFAFVDDSPYGYGPELGVVTASSLTVSSMANEFFERRYSGLRVRIDRYGLGLRISWRDSGVIKESAVDFIMKSLTLDLNNRLGRWSVTLTASYNYTLFEHYRGNTAPVAGGGGGSKLGGDTGREPGSDGGNTGEKPKEDTGYRKTYKEPVLDTSQAQEAKRREIEDVIMGWLNDTLSLKLDPELYAVYKDSTFNLFKRVVQGSQEVEHGMTFQQLNGVIYGKGLVSGDKDEVRIYPYGNTVLMVHNHPGQTPPSFSDLIAAGEATGISPIFNASLIYTHGSGDLYVIYVDSPSKARTFVDKCRPQVDVQTGGYQKSGSVIDMIRKNQKTIRRFEHRLRNIYTLALLLYENDSGMKLSKLDSKGRNTLYDFKRDTKGNLIPIITR